jgi:hypothetical protein
MGTASFSAGSRFGPGRQGKRGFLITRGYSLFEVTRQYQLDKGLVNWSDDSYEIDENYNTDWFYGSIRIWRSDIEANFSIEIVKMRRDALRDQSTDTPTNSQLRLQPLQDAGVKAPDREVGLWASASEGRRRGRPPDSRKEVHEWLDDELAKHGLAGVDKSDTVLAHMYCTEVLRIRDEDLLRKGVDAQRKHVRTWKQRRDRQG